MGTLITVQLMKSIISISQVDSVNYFDHSPVDSVSN